MPTKIQKLRQKGQKRYKRSDRNAIKTKKGNQVLIKTALIKTAPEQLKMQRRRSTRVAGKEVDQAGTSVSEPPFKKQRNIKKEPPNEVEELDRQPILKKENSVQGPGPGYVSAYEASIQKNIQERMEMLKMLQIDTIKEEVKEAMAELKPKRKSFKRVQPVKDLTPSRRSLRISGRDPTGVELPPRPASPPALPPPRKLGTETVTSASTGFSEPEDTVRQLADISRQLAEQEPPSDISADSYRGALAGLAVTEKTWTKVTPLRIAALAFCPLRQKHVLAAGDKRGVLGLWDVSRGEDGVHMFSAHTGHIVGLSFSPTDGSRCYTSSYDGVSRCLDLERQQLDQVYATPESEPDMYLNHHTHVGDHGLLLAQSDGRLVRRDLRSSDVSYQRLSERCLRFLSVHPSREHCLAVVERPSTVSLWDLRQVKGPRSALQRLTLPRSCASAAISGGTGDQLVAPCSDDTIRLYGGITQGHLNPTKTIRHNNHTGRWLTTFKPIWLPGSDDFFLVGSMEQPRRMEVFDRCGSVYHLLMGQEMQAVCSTIVCHPSEPAIAGANSSGKVYLYR